MAYDEWGNWYDDSAWAGTEYESYMPDYTGDMGYYSEPIDWSALDLTPEAIEFYGLTDADFLPTDPSVGGGGYTGVSDILRSAGTRYSPYGGAEPTQATEEEIAQIQQAASDWAAQGGDAAGFQRALSGVGGKIGAMASQLGTSAWDAILKNPLSAAAMLAGGGAALAGALAPGVQPMRPGDIIGQGVQLSPEQRQLFQYIQSQAGREEELAEAQMPIQRGVIDATSAQLAGLGGLAPAEMAARERELANIAAAQGLIGEELGRPAEPSEWEKMQFEKARQRQEKQYQEALGTGYTTSTPYTQDMPVATAGLASAAQRAAEARQAGRLASLRGVADPGAYRGLESTADTLGKLSAVASGAAPRGAAERGLGAISGERGRQEQLISSMEEFNRQLQAQKNQDVWKFAGTALGGGLYGMRNA